MIKSKKESKSVKSSSKSRGKDDTYLVSNAPGKSSFFLITVIGIVVIAAVVVLAKTFLTDKPAEQPRQNQKMEQQKVEGETDLERLVNRVAQMIEINRSEEPTIATVQDPALLRNGQPEFYKEAEKGDRLLVWSDKAVLYSTKKDKLLSVMMIAGQESTTTEPTTPDITSTITDESPTINVKNGTLTAGAAGRMKTLLTGEDIPVAGIGDAKLKNYDKTVIIQITDKEMPATLKALKDTTGAEVTEPLDGETGLLGDFVVIVGNDFDQ